MQIECIFQGRHRLAEGPLWDSTPSRLLWADIENGMLHSTDADGGQHQELALPGGITSISLTDSDHYICTQEKRFLLLSRSFETVWQSDAVEDELPDNRFNDAKVDPHGHLWAGTMHRHLSNPSGHLYRLGSHLRWAAQDSGYIVSNGPTFSHHGDLMWHTDSIRRRIYRFSLTTDGVISDKKVFVRFEDDEGVPDGMTTDREGCLWIASFAGARITRFSPSGERLLRVDLPTSNITSCTFGGEDYRSLFVTTATSGLNQVQTAQQPLAGSIFRIDGDFQGLAPNRFHIDPVVLEALLIHES